MSGKRTGRLPAEVVGFWLIVHSLKNPKPRDHHLLAPDGVPEEVEKVAVAIEKAVKPQGKKKPYEPKARLNRSFAALRREHPNLFLKVHRWLLQPQVREQFSRKGHSATWNRWVEGVAQIHEGKLATQALGMERVGKSRKMEFGIHHDAAIVAEYLTQVEGLLYEEANKQAVRLLGDRTLDRRGVQRWRKRVCAIKPSKADLKEQYAAIARKYRLN